MARLWSSGFELNSTSTGMEISGAAATGITVDATIFRSGAYSSKLVASGLSQRWAQTYALANSNGPYYLRAYFYATVEASGNTPVLMFRDSSNTDQLSIRYNTGTGDGNLILHNEEDNAQIGSAFNITLNTWYRLEISYDSNTLASTSVEGKIDGTTFASGTVNWANGCNQIAIGNGAGNGTGTYYWDDIAINDSTGSFQNSWPGEGSIIHLRPNAEGDTVNWSNGVSSTNWENVDEVTPDDASTVNTSTVLNDIDEYNLDATPAAINSNDTINCVQVGLRIGNSASANHDYTPRIKAAASGTVEEGTAITITNSTFVTNAVSVPRNYNLTLYDLPGASTTAWTKADLDTAQIGVKHTADASFNAQVSAMWLLVDYAPAAGGGSSFKYIPQRMRMGMGV